ncbi:MAG: enoyl-CoA hydratase/isomerase family protein [Betaproteobacteria bacterium]|nr:enoyl-CoA hydratase/isomerase family protein [Betaproteobacteria bacterium]
MTAAAHLSYPTTGVGLIILDNPPKNFGTTELAMQILKSLEAAARAGCKVAILASDTPGYFLAHWSLQSIIDMQQPAPERPQVRPAQPGLFETIETLPMIVIAANNGQAWGGGAELSWASDLRIAAESATYGQPEVALGIIPGAGGTTRLARLVGESHCMAMILDGRPVSAREALAMGAINKLVPDARLREESIAWAAHIARWPAASLAACKRSLVEGRDLPLGAARRNESQIFRELARREESLTLMRAAQLQYDAGADSHDVLGFERRRSPGESFPIQV